MTWLSITKYRRCVRNFNGKEYVKSGWIFSKSTAETMAKDMRNRGYLVRTIPSKGNEFHQKFNSVDGFNIFSRKI